MEQYAPQVSRSCRKVFAREITQCTPARVNTAFDEIESMLVEEGVMLERGGCILEPEDVRLLVVDEKGFSSRSDSAIRGIIPAHLKGKAVTKRRHRQLSRTSASVVFCLWVDADCQLGLWSPRNNSTLTCLMYTKQADRTL